MPELPEVEVQRRNLRRWARGRRIAAVGVRDARAVEGSPTGFRRRLIGRTVQQVERKGKQLLLVLDGGVALASHLGMTGKWLHDTGDGELPPSTRVVLTLDGGGRLLYRDPRLFGRLRIGMAEALRTELFERLGADPLAPGWDGDLLAERLAGTRRAIKAALLDQSRVAGIGNIQASEALWRARIHPGRPAGSLERRELGRLARAIRESIDDTIAAEQGDVVRYVEEAGAPNPFRIYRREGEPCPRCGTPIERSEIGGRGTFHCPRCQRRHP